MEDATLLIQQAFERAKVSGKPDWHRMTTAVLKNRLLDLTGNTFNEAKYCADTFTAFVLRYSDIVHLDRSKFPPIVQLRDAELDTLAPGYVETASNRVRVRSDLWQAVLDYSSGTRYVWDEAKKQALPSVGGRRQFNPSLTKCYLKLMHQQWRGEFFDTSKNIELPSRPNKSV